MKKMYCKLAVLMAEKDVKLTQQKLAKDTGLGSSTVNRLFNNTFDRVDRGTVETLCKYFECEVGQLFVLREVVDDKK